MPLPKLLWHSNAPWAGTGYGQQTALFTPRLQEQYEVVISAFWGLEAAVIPWKGISVLPGIGSDYGNETIAEHARVTFGPNVRDGMILTLMDAWVLEPQKWGQFNVASWVPVDHKPVPGPVRSFFEESGAIPICMSQFGVDEFEGLDPLYCPHGIDTKEYKPYPKAEARAEVMGLPEDAFIVGMVAANKGNPSRKCFAEAFQAFKVFKERVPEALLYVHSEVTGRFAGVNLPALIDSVGIDRKAVHFCDQYRAVHFPFPAETMAKVYSSMDVLLAASAGEGFGIPVVEAQACGTQVIVSDFSAQPELCGAGWIVEGGKRYTAIGSWLFVPDIEDITDALMRAYHQSTAEREKCESKARKFAEGYDVDTVLERYMLPALGEAQRRFAAREPKTLKAA